MMGHQPCGYGYKLLYKIFEAMEDRSEEIHVTDITGCLLRSWAIKKHPSPKYIHELLTLWIGTAIHKALELDNALVQSEVSIEYEDLKGRVDTIYNDSIYEDIKTTRWLYVSNLPYGNHAEQVQTYGAMGGADRLLLQYIDLSGPTQCKSCKLSLILSDGQMTCPNCGEVNNNGHLGAVIKEIPLNNDMEWIMSRVKKLRDAMETNIPPAPEDSFLCKYCDYTECKFNWRRS